MKEEWDKRYREPEYIYGTEPNEFLRAELSQCSPGRIVFPGDGEGRNSVFAASQGWDVYAFDYSESAREKALALADIHSVSIRYEVMDAANFHPSKGFCDVLALFFVHFPPDQRSFLFPQWVSLLQPGSSIWFEAFSKAQMPRTSGGPKILPLLYSLEEIPHLFPGVDFLQLEEIQVMLNEGKLHQGEASVIRCKGVKL